MLLTWNEERSIASCLESLARQGDRDFDVTVLDAASTDATAAIVASLREAYPVPLRLVVAERRIPIGEARNRGAALARAPAVAFLSADAEAEPGWTAAARRALASADAVFGRQLHDPRRWTVGAAVRGLRYRFPSAPPPDPLPFASNVAAAYRREVLAAFPFDPDANAAEDLVLARRAARAGFRVAYDPALVVRHHDVEGARGEWRKSLREGQGWARYAKDLGHPWPLLTWGGALLAAAAAAAALPPAGLPLFALVVWAPALRRALRGRPAGMPRRWLVAAVAASPAFDLAFLASYLGGLLRCRAGRLPPPTTPETRT